MPPKHRNKSERLEERKGKGNWLGTVALVWAIIATVGLVLVLLTPVIFPTTSTCMGTFRLCVDDEWEYDADPDAHQGSIAYSGMTCSQNLWNVIRDNDLDSEADYDAFMALHPELAEDLGYVSESYSYVTNLWGMINSDHENDTSLVGKCIDIPVTSIFAVVYFEVSIFDEDGNWIDEIDFEFVSSFSDPVNALNRFNATQAITCTNKLVTIEMMDLTYVDVDTYEANFLVNGVLVILDGEG